MSAAAELPAGVPVTRRALVVGLGLCALLAALSLVSVGQPTGNDPNSWLVWATQLAQGNGVDFSVGPSWKPLPVLLDLPLAVVSSTAATTWWIWLVRFSALATALVLFLLVRRDSGGFGGAAGGVVAGLAIFSIQPWSKSAVIGMSEPVLMALALGAVLAAIEGRDRLALGLALAAGLIRPEVWPFVIAWLGWRAWRKEISVRHAIALAAGSLAAWLIAWYGIPVALGADLTQASDRAAEAMKIGSSGTGLFKVWAKDLPGPVIWWLVLWGAAVGLLFRSRTEGRRILLVLGSSIAWLLITWLLNALGTEPGIPRYALPAFVAWCWVIGASVAMVLNQIRQPATTSMPGTGFGWTTTPTAKIGFTWLIGGFLALAVSAGAVHAMTGLWSGSRAYLRSSDQQLAALNKAGSIDALGGCLPFATSGYPSHARILARRTYQPLQAVTGNPENMARAIVLVSSNPAVGSQPRLPRSIPAPLAKVGDWTALYFGDRTGCSTPK